MENFNVLTTLFVGIDVSSQNNVVYAMDFHKHKLLSCTVANNQQGAVCLGRRIVELMEGSEFQAVVFALESTSFYSLHIANYLSSDPTMLALHPSVYCLNPKQISNYRKSYVDLQKNDQLDAFLLADFARVGRIQTSPWRGSQFLALQRLTRHRLHLVQSMTREKAYMVSNVYLKFSELTVRKNGDHPFHSNYSASAEALLTEFYSLQDIVDTPVEDLTAFLVQAGKNRFSDPEKVAEILTKAARDSYRLDKQLYEPINTAIASSFNCISTFEREIKDVNKAIEKTLKGLQKNELQCLLSIPGIGPVLASGILAEIGSIQAFRSQEALAKYAGLTWSQNQSGSFEADDTHMTKSGNSYLRYYLVEAANSVRLHIPEYANFYHKKYHEVKTHQHKRALALTARKLIRLLFGLLAKEQLYSADRVEQLT